MLLFFFFKWWIKSRFSINLLCCSCDFVLFLFMLLKLKMPRFTVLLIEVKCTMLFSKMLFFFRLSLNSLSLAFKERDPQCIGFVNLLIGFRIVMIDTECYFLRLSKGKNSTQAHLEPSTHIYTCHMLRFGFFKLKKALARAHSHTISDQWSEIVEAD